MKKIKFLSAVALTLVMASCDDFDLPNPPGQSFPEPAGIFQNSDLVIEEVPEETIDLVSANAQNKFINVGLITSVNNFPEGYDLEVDMEVAKNDAFENFTTLATTIDGYNLTVNPDYMNAAVQEVITREPGTYPVAIRFAAYAVKENTRMRLGGLDHYYGQNILRVKTLDAAKVLEDAYYFVPTDAAGAPDWNAAMNMANTSGEGVSPYDNPEFAVKFETAAENTYHYMIAPATVYLNRDRSGLMGVNMAEGSLSGKLAVGYAPGVVPLAGSVLATINVEQDAISLNYAFDVLYPFCNAVSASNMMLLYTDNYINYYGVMAINQRFYIGTQADKKGVNFRQAQDVEPVLSENGLQKSGELAISDVVTEDITFPLKKLVLCWANVNLVQKTYEVRAMETLALIGDGNGWDHATSLPLTPAKNLKTWTATDVHLGSMVKIAANGSWDDNFGGVVTKDADGNFSGTLQYNGPDMNIEEGTYDVTIDFSVLPYAIQLNKKH
ncbi:MAG: hypothetical protein HDS26_06985 [Bacteroides sp.]|nr:hypothetical protein [Bacteroides sp.]